MWTTCATWTVADFAMSVDASANIMSLGIQQKMGRVQPNILLTKLLATERIHNSVKLAGVYHMSCRLNYYDA